MILIFPPKSRKTKDRVSRISGKSNADPRRPARSSSVNPGLVKHTTIISAILPGDLMSKATVMIIKYLKPI
jgi:hypothetical protein